MDSEFPEDLPEHPFGELGDIPSSFHRFMEKEPFNECIQCSCALYEGQSAYVIQKSYVGKEVIFEFAICDKCHGQLGQEVSKESLQAIKNFIYQNVQFGRSQTLLENESRDLTPWLKDCIICNTPRNSMKRFTDIAYCIGDQLMFGELPMMICETCELKYQKLLSKKTRERLGDFIGNHFDGAPEHADLTPDRTPVLI